MTSDAPPPSTSSAGQPSNAARAGAGPAFEPTPKSDAHVYSERAGPVPTGTLFARLRDNPNPVWMRELKQAARLQRTPVILAVVTGMMTLLICSVGGVASTSSEPAKVGVGIFHTFFSLAYAVVTWVGPAVAANTIAGERSGRTWEALQLTGLSPRRIARGKFMAAFTYISLYVVMLVPVGALPFLFGGVTASEVLIAFALLFVVAAVAVAFGLAVSAKFSSPAAAIIVTLLVALPISLLVYGGGGVGLSMVAHEQWPNVPAGPPVWLPTALVRADFGLAYLAFLLLLPLVLTVLPGWLFYEVTVANMGAVSDDRSTRLRVWFACAVPALTFSVVLVGSAVHDLGWSYAAGALLWAFGCFAAFLFAGEPLGPSLRVQNQWRTERVSRLRRAFGPGLMSAFSLLGLLTLLGLACSALAGAAHATAAAERDAILAFHGYGMGFFCFVLGFTAWVRARSASLSMPRVLLAAALFVATVGPWIVMAVAGVITNRHDEAMLMASPSPTFAVTMAQAISNSTPEAGLVASTGAACAVAWALIGFGLFVAAGVRVRARLATEALVRHKLQRAFDDEDALLAAVEAEPSEG